MPPSRRIKHRALCEGGRASVRDHERSVHYQDPSFLLSALKYKICISSQQLSAPPQVSVGKY